jgi:hypothetical protein
MTPDSSTTENLLRLAGHADRSAIGRLLKRHRLRLRRMVAARLDRRIAARVDPSFLSFGSRVRTRRRRLPGHRPVLRPTCAARPPWHFVMPTNKASFIETSNHRTS